MSGSGVSPRQGMTAPTLKDIAERVGVSVGTVSAVLNDMPRAQRYAEKTRQRVRAVAEELGYTGTPLGRVLRSKLAGTLGIICFSQPDMYSSHLLHSAEAEIAALGYVPILASMHYDETRFETCLRRLSQWRVEGILIMMAGRPISADILERLTHTGVPYIAIDSRDMEHPIAPHVDYESGRLVGEHLGQLGHRRICVAGFNPGTAHAHDRLAGIRAALKAFGVEVPDASVLERPQGAYGAFAGYTNAEQMLDAPGSPDAPTALVCMNDLIAFGALRRLHEQGIAIPAQLSVTGFDDMCLDAMVSDENRMGPYMQPALTTVRVPHPEVGRELARKLVQIVGGKSDSEIKLEDVLQPRLIVRESTGPAPAHTAG
jgi:LacI family transcriptional regulator